MRIIFDYPGTSEPDDVTDEIRRVAGMIDEGYTSGVLALGVRRGWWKIEQEATVESPT